MRGGGVGDKRSANPHAPAHAATAPPGRVAAARRLPAPAPAPRTPQDTPRAAAAVGVRPESARAHAHGGGPHDNGVSASRADPHHRHAGYTPAAWWERRPHAADACAGRGDRSDRQAPFPRPAAPHPGVPPRAAATRVQRFGGTRGCVPTTPPHRTHRAADGTRVPCTHTATPTAAPAQRLDGGGDRCPSLHASGTGDAPLRTHRPRPGTPPHRPVTDKKSATEAYRGSRGGDRWGRLGGCVAAADQPRRRVTPTAQPPRALTTVLSSSPSRKCSSRLAPFSPTPSRLTVHAVGAFGSASR